MCLCVCVCIPVYVYSYLDMAVLMFLHTYRITYAYNSLSANTSQSVSMQSSCCRLCHIPAFCVLIFYAMHRFLLSKTTFESFHESLILCSCICFVTDNIVAFLWVICHFSLALFQILLSSLIFSHFLAYFLVCSNIFC